MSAKTRHAPLSTHVSTPPLCSHRSWIQRRAIEAWEKLYSGRLKKGKGEKALRYIAPVDPAPLNHFTFKGYVALPPKPIITPDRNTPHCYLSVSHTAPPTEEAGYRSVVCVAAATGDLAVDIYTQLVVGDEVLVTGKFVSHKTRWGIRTSTVLKSVEKLRGVAEVREEILEQRRRAGDPNTVMWRGWGDSGLVSDKSIPPSSLLQSLEDLEKLNRD